jgi:uncharacterized protein (DUF1015 family)
LADVRPFAGVTYDPGRVDLSRVLCPPYDVISPVQQAAYAARDSHNAVRIVLNPAPGDQRYAEAGTALQAWLKSGVLRKAERPALYVHRHTFELRDAGEVARTGLIAAVRLEPWASGAIRPHEHTMPGPKADRLQLMRATGADTEPIWVFHLDPAGELRARLAQVLLREPLLTAQFRPEPAADEIAAPERHELWAVEDAAEIVDLSAAAGAGPLYIADGHHRYETALFHAGESDGPSDAATHFKVMLLTAAEDPGLKVLPTHRLIRFSSGGRLDDMMAELRRRGWSAEELPGREALLARLDAPSAMTLLGFGVFSQGRWTYLEGRIAGPQVDLLPPSIAALDVGLIHEGILRPLLDIGPAELASSRDVAYARDAREVEARVSAGEFDVGILVRPPTLGQIQAVADAGESMPQKSTFFWPKPASGLVMALQERGSRLDPSLNEDVRG